MKLGTTRARLKGLQLGEVTINLLESLPVLQAKFAYVRDDGEFMGSVSKGRWSEKTHEALKKLAEAMEEDMAVEVFEMAIEMLEGASEQSPKPVGESVEPPQV